MIPIGKVLQRARELQGLSRPQMADLIGVIRQQVYKVEAGHASPSLATIEKFSNALGIPVWQLIKIAQKEEWLSRKRREKFLSKEAA
jgi:transcriptional regulator with XRE-family HTH domain